MPFLIPATNNYFGFMPAEGADARTRIYLVSATEANQISYGDVVCMATSAGACSVRRATGSTTTDAGIMVGVAASVVVANGGSTAASMRSLTSQNVLVWDDPATIFVGCDTTSGILGLGEHIGKSVGIVSTGVTGSTGLSSLNRSVQAVSIVTASSGGTPGFRFRIIGVHPVETGFSTAAASGTAGAATEVRKLLLKPDTHANAGYGVGIGHVTT